MMTIHIWYDKRNVFLPKEKGGLLWKIKVPLQKIREDN